MTTQQRLKKREPVRAEYLSIFDAADYLAVSHKTLRLWISQGLLNAYNSPTGRTLRIRRSDLDALMTLVPTAAPSAKRGQR